MGFGGGGSGSFVLPNHTHTNVLADGGALSDTSSLVDAATIQVWFDNEYAAVKGSISSQKDTLSPQFTTTSGTYVDVTGITLTLPNNTGKALIALMAQYKASANQHAFFKIYDGSAQDEMQNRTDTVNAYYSNTVTHIADNDGQVIKVQCAISGGATLTVDTATFLNSFEVQFP